MIFAFKCGCSLSGKHLWIHQDSPIPRPTKHGKFQEPLATSPWGRSWNGASPGVQQPGGPGEVVPKRFCVKAWCLELIKVYKSGKFLMIFYDILSYTVYIYIHTHHIYIYFSLDVEPLKPPAPPFFVWRSFFMSWWSAHWGDLQLWRQRGRSGNPTNEMEGLYLGK